jgi:hypothetical protein
MAIISGALLVEGPFEVVLEWLGKLWPVALIIGGIAMLLGARKLNKKEPESDELTEPDEIAIEKPELE